MHWIIHGSKRKCVYLFTQHISRGNALLYYKYGAPFQTIAMVILDKESKCLVMEIQQETSRHGQHKRKQRQPVSKAITILCKRWGFIRQHCKAGRKLATRADNHSASREKEGKIIKMASTKPIKNISLLCAWLCHQEHVLFLGVT